MIGYIPLFGCGVVGVLQQFERTIILILIINRDKTFIFINAAMRRRL